MFDRDVAGLDAGAALAAAAELRAIADRAEAKLLEVAAHFADLHPEPDLAADTDWLPGMERAREFGGQGCPEVAEFAPVEFGAALGLSSAAAARLIGEALGLRHRLPRLWARVRAGQVPAWRARQVAAACAARSQPVATQVDQRVAPIAETVTSYRLERIVTAAILRADPAAARAEVDKAARDRGVWVQPADLLGTKTVYVQAAAGDVARFDGSLDLVADCLARLGDTGSKDQRRAQAIGWLASPQATLNLWDYTSTLGNTRTARDTSPLGDTGTLADTGTLGDTGTAGDGSTLGDTGTAGDGSAPGDTGTAGDGNTPGDTRTAGDSSALGEVAADGTPGDLLTRLRDTAGRFAPSRSQRPGRSTGSGRAPAATTVYVHVAEESLTGGDGVLRVDGRGTGDSNGLTPMWVSQLAELVGHDRFVVKPVIDLRDRISVDSYEIPDRIRDHVQLRHPTCVFPWCHRPAVVADLDHVTPYDDTGPPGQTATDTLLPGCRLHHRVKTHGRWTCHLTPCGAVEWTSPHGRRYRVDHTGTHPLTEAE